MVNENDRHIKCNFYEWIWSPFSRFISFEWSFLTELYVRTWIFWICNWLLANVTSFSKQEFEWAHKSFLNFFQTVKLITGIHKMTSNWTEWWSIIWYADIQKNSTNIICSPSLSSQMYCPIFSKEVNATRLPNFDQHAKRCTSMHVLKLVSFLEKRI